MKRLGRNPATGAAVDVLPKKVAFFKPSKELRSLVNGAVRNDLFRLDAWLPGWCPSFGYSSLHVSRPKVTTTDACGNLGHVASSVNLAGRNALRVVECNGSGYG